MNLDALFQITRLLSFSLQRSNNFNSPWHYAVLLNISQMNTLINSTNLVNQSGYFITYCIVTLKFRIPSLKTQTCLIHLFIVLILA